MEYTQPMLSPIASASPPRDLLDRGALDDIARRLGAVVQRSPADETEVVWLDTQSHRVSVEDDVPAAETDRETAALGGEVHQSGIHVRVRERGRVGMYRTGSHSQPEVDTAVRQALGHARMAGPSPALPLARPGGRLPEIPSLHDATVADLSPSAARDLLAAGRQPGEALTLEWHRLRWVVVNSLGLSRATEATALTLHARHGNGPGAGHAAASSRTLSDLAAPQVLERARRRAVDGRGSRELPGDGRPLLLCPEAVAALIQTLADTALSSRNFTPERSFLANRLGQRVASEVVSLYDDGSRTEGLPFPVDWGGWLKRPMAMVERGVLVSPALDLALAQRLDRTPTPHAVAFDESRAQNLFVGTADGAWDREENGASGESDAVAEADLLGAAEAGVAICRLEAVRITDPARGRFRATARGLRRIRQGALGEALPDATWSGSLDAVLGGVTAAGGPRVTRAGQSAWGGVTAPGWVIAATGEWQPADLADPAPPDNPVNSVSPLIPAIPAEAEA